MTDTRTPIGWVRNDRKVTWWGADYPVHWEPGEGFAIYGEPAQAASVVVTSASTEAQRADNRMRERVLEGAQNVERLRVALGECQDKLWIARCDSGDEKFRAVAERACDMAAEALKAASTIPAYEDEAALKASVKSLITHRRAGDYDLMADDVANALWPLLRNVPHPSQAAARASGQKMNAWIGDILAQATAGPKEGLRSADHLFDMIAGGLFDHPNKSAPEGAIRLLADDLWTMIGLQAASDQFAAFRAGWRTNAALPADDPAYFERCAETDWLDYLKRGAAAYNAGLDEAAQQQEAGAESAAQAEVDALKGATEALQQCWGALNFILAFYDPNQRHLDTNAWKQAEASGRRAHAHARVVLDDLKVKPEDEENPWRSQDEWSNLLRLRDDFIVDEGLWAAFTDRLEKTQQVG